VPLLFITHVLAFRILVQRENMMRLDGNAGGRQASLGSAS